MSHLVRLCIVLLGVSASSVAQGPNPEEQAVRQTLDHYLAGHATGDPSHIRIAFQADAMLFWVDGGQLRQRSVADYIAGFTGRPAVDEDRRRRWIDHVDVAGSAATGRIVLEYPNARFVDYMALLKIDGEWKIVNKTFHREPRS